MKQIVTPFRVGMLVLVAGAFLFVFLAFTTKGGLSEREAIQVHARFADASGLGVKSRIQVAGIPVGEVISIRLDGTRALLEMRVRRDVDLREDATIAKRSESLLGDYMLDLNPGTPGAAPMPEGGEVRVLDAKGMDQLMASVNSIADDVKKVTESLREVLGGEEGQASLQAIVDNVRELTEHLNTTVQASEDRLARILANVEQVTADVRTLTQGQQSQLRRVADDIEAITGDTRALIAAFRQSVEGMEGEDLQQSVASVKKTLADLESTVSNVEEISRKIREGEGTVGALVSDEALGQRVTETVDGLADFADRITRTQLEVGIRSEYLVNLGGARNTLGVRLIPSSDRYYLIEIVDDALGTTETTLVRNLPPGTEQPAAQVQLVTREQLKFNAQFAKRFYFATLRLGVKESTGGAGLDLHFLNDSLAINTDLFNLSVQSLQYPRLRAGLRYQAFNHLVLTAGIDDALNPIVRDTLTNQVISGRDYFVGAGIYFTDDDLKSLLPFIPVP